MIEADLIMMHAPSNYDFRDRAIMYGPISDVIPSTPIFEMYPIGFVSICANLEKNGLHARIINIANRMLNDKNFNVEKFLSKLSARAFGIDLHWLPHAQGSLEIAKIVKKYHPHIPVIFGGLSASYFYKELIEYPQVDFIVRGDSTETPMLMLMQRIKMGGGFDNIPNLSWKDNNAVNHNAITWIPENLDAMQLDYNYPIRSVLKYRDLKGITPFYNWMDYPITCVVTCRGCTMDCVTCGGSRYAYKNSYCREKPAFRDPHILVKDITSIQRFLKGPIFVIGDIRQPGEEYADNFLQAMKNAKIDSPVILELFWPAKKDFFASIDSSISHYNIQWSPDSADEEVRRAFGKGYSNIEIENTIEAALTNGCKRFDLFYMTGLPQQTYESVMETSKYLRALLSQFNKTKRILPFISPLAPFVDPGSKVFENPDKYGYTLLYKTLEQHRKALQNPSWKYMLNYETAWMNKHEIVMSTYEAALAFNQLKSELGLITREYADGVESRAKNAIDLMKSIDNIVRDDGMDSLELMNVKSDADSLSVSSICQKKELNWPCTSFIRNAPRILWAFATKRDLQ